MRILFLAPQPFYQQRGTPIAIKLILEELAQRGDHVDVLTYHEGENIDLPNVILHRTPNFRLVRNIRPGFSFKKLICDFFLTIMALRVCLRTRFEVVYAVEESAFIALLLKFLWRMPYVYDMDSSLPEQLIEKHSGLTFLLPLLRRLERLVVKNALVVIPVCDALCDSLQAYPLKRTVVLYDVPLPQETTSDSTIHENVRDTLGCLVMYVGNLEPYQGIDLLLNSFAVACQSVAELRLVIIGGREDDIEAYRRKCSDLAIADRVRFLGPRPVTHLASYLAQADILASPRVRGRNTPMKIFSYLESGKPILATNLATHTQVLDERSALLAAATPQAFAEGLVRLAREESLRQSLGETAKQYARDKYSYERFRQTFHELMKSVQSEAAFTL